LSYAGVERRDASYRRPRKLVSADRKHGPRVGDDGTSCSQSGRWSVTCIACVKASPATSRTRPTTSASCKTSLVRGLATTQPHTRCCEEGLVVAQGGLATRRR